MDETQKKMLQAQNAKIEEVDAEYIITKDFKYESAKIDMIMSSNGKDKAHIITNANIHRTKSLSQYSCQQQGKVLTREGPKIKGLSFFVNTSS